MNAVFGAVVCSALKAAYVEGLLAARSPSLEEAGENFGSFYLSPDPRKQMLTVDVTFEGHLSCHPAGFELKRPA